jgi:hypothetical protein
MNLNEGASQQASEQSMRTWNLGLGHGYAAEYHD